MKKKLLRQLVSVLAVELNKMQNSFNALKDHVRGLSRELEDTKTKLHHAHAQNQDKYLVDLDDLRELVKPSGKQRKIQQVETVRKITGCKLGDANDFVQEHCKVVPKKA